MTVVYVLLVVCFLLSLIAAIAATLAAGTCFNTRCYLDDIRRDFSNLDTRIDNLVEAMRLQDDRLLNAENKLQELQRTTLKCGDIVITENTLKVLSDEDMDGGK